MDLFLIMYRIWLLTDIIAIVVIVSITLLFGSDDFVFYFIDLLDFGNGIKIGTIFMHLLFLPITIFYFIKLIFDVKIK